MTEQLKPCPFCGGEAKHTSRANDSNGWQHDVDHWVYCTSDDCLADMGMCETKDEAVRLWNARDPDAKCKQIGDTSEVIAKEIWSILVGDLPWDEFPQCHIEYRLAARAAIAAMKPALAKHQPCGCIVCMCENEDQCQGCGAKNCGNHPVGEIPDPIYMQPTPQMQCIHMTAEMAANCPTCNPSALRGLPTGVVEVCPICDIAGCHHIRERNAAPYTVTPQEAAKVLLEWVDGHDPTELDDRLTQVFRSALCAIASEDSK